jgi:hypothetical protein
MDEWKIKIEKKPLNVEGQVCKAGDIIMDKSVREFKADYAP